MDMIKQFHLDPYIYDLEKQIRKLKLKVNSLASGLEPWQLIFYTAIITLILRWLWSVFQNGGSFSSAKNRFLFWLRHLPVIRNYVEKEINKISNQVAKDLWKGLERVEYINKLPRHGWSEKKILEALANYQKLNEADYSGGKVSGTVYHGNDENLHNLMTEIYGLTAYTNPLHPDVFIDIRIIEAEVVRIGCDLFGGGPESCGTVTTGGTESIILVCKAYRDYARSRGISDPEMIIPITAHAAFDKAAQLLNMKVKHIPLDPVTMEVNVKAMKKAISRNTCMLVGSAPQYPHGIIDPIEEIAKIGLKYNIPVHVDCCLGGFLVPFMKRLGFSIPSFDFKVPGVTSISADPHKYGFAPKGSSLIMYRNKVYRHYQFQVVPDWPGGIYASPNLGGSRSGGIIASTWASFMYHGEEGYLLSTKSIIQTTQYLVKGLREIPNIFVHGNPLVSVVAIGSKDFDALRLCDELGKSGWFLNRLQFPSAFHICITLQHTQKGVADKFLSDVRTCVAEIMKDPKAPLKGTAAVYGMAQALPDRTIVSELAWAFLDACYNYNVTKEL